MILKEGGARLFLRFFGLFFLLPGLFMVGALLGLVPVSNMPASGTMEWVLLFFLGLAFVGAGGWMVFYTTGMVFDGLQSAVVTSSGWSFLRLKSQSQPLSQFRQMVMTYQEESDDSSAVYYYALWLEDGRGFHQPVARYRDVRATMDLALKLNERFAFNLLDKTMKQEKLLNEDDLIDALRQPGQGSSRFISRKEIEALPFRSPVPGKAYSTLEKAAYKGGTVFRVTYPKFIVMRLFVLGVTLTFFTNFMSWDIDGYVKMYSEFDIHNLNPEMFFSTVLATLFILMLVVFPVIGLLREILKKPRYAILFVEPDFLTIDDMDMQTERGRYHPIGVTLRRGDIQSVDIKAASAKTWKIAQYGNGLLIRTRTGIMHTAQALDEAQLEAIRADISTIMRLK